MLSQPLLLNMLPIVAIVGIFYFMVLRPMNNRQKAVREFQQGLKVGDRIIMTSGIHGQITKLSDKTVKVQIADRVIVEVARAAVGGLQGEEPKIPIGSDQSN
jgi:preprotein translocase subunit YajC